MFGILTCKKKARGNNGTGYVNGFLGNIIFWLVMFAHNGWNDKACLSNHILETLCNGK